MRRLPEHFVRARCTVAGGHPSAAERRRERAGEALEVTPTRASMGLVAAEILGHTSTPFGSRPAMRSHATIGLLPPVFPARQNIPRHRSLSTVRRTHQR